MTTRNPWASPGFTAFLRAYADHAQGRAVRKAVAGLGEGLACLEGGRWTGKTRTILTLGRRMEDRRPADETLRLRGFVCDLPFSSTPRAVSDMVLYSLKGHRGGQQDLTTKQSLSKAVSALDRAEVGMLAFEVGDWAKVRDVTRQSLLALAEVRSDPTVLVGCGFGEDGPTAGVPRLTLGPYAIGDEGFAEFVGNMVRLMPTIADDSLDDTGHLERIHAATNGVVGPVADLLRDAFAFAVEEGADALGERHLSAAHSRLAARKSTTFHVTGNPWS